MANPEVSNGKDPDLAKEKTERPKSLEGLRKTRAEKFALPADQSKEWEALEESLYVAPLTAAPERMTPAAKDTTKEFVKTETQRSLTILKINALMGQVKDEKDSVRLKSFANEIRQSMEEFDMLARSYELGALGADIEDANLKSLEKKDVEAVKKYLLLKPRPPLKYAGKLQIDAYDTALKTWETMETRAGQLQAHLYAGKTAEAEAEGITLKPHLAAFPGQLESYETLCGDTGMTVFKDTMGMKDIPDAEFRELLASFKQSLTSPEKAANQKNRKRLDELYPDLEKQRTKLANDTDKRLLRLGQATSQDNLDVEMAFWKEDIVAHLVNRRHYETLAGQEPKKTEQWMQLLGLAAQEALEDAAEAYKFKEKPSRQKFKEGQGLDAATQDQLVRETDKIKVILEKAGIKATPRMLKVLSTIAESPLGGQLLKSMIKFESPATVLLFAVYLHSSENKVKAAIEWAGFMAVSHLSGEMLVAIDRIFMSKAAMQATAWKKVSNPALKFSAALLLMFGLNKEFKDLTDRIDKNIPESVLKDTAGVVISALSGEVFISYGVGRLEDNGIIKMNPQTEQKKFLLSKKFDLGPSDYGIDVAKYRYTRSLADWNKAVDQAMADAKNPVQKRMWELEKITDPAAWAKREAASIFPVVAEFKRSEHDINEQLKQKGQSFPPLNLVETVIADNGIPNDRAFAGGIQDRSDIAEYIRSLDDKEPLKQSWKTYETRGTDIAQMVRMYRHLTTSETYDQKTGEISYNRQEWFGDLNGQPLTKVVQEGLQEELIYTLKRKEATRLRNGESATYLIDAMEGPEAAKWDVGSLIKDIANLDGMLELITDRKAAERTAKDAEYAVELRNDLKQLARKLDPYLEKSRNEKTLNAKLFTITKPLRDLASRKSGDVNVTIQEMEKARQSIVDAINVLQLSDGDLSGIGPIEPKLREDLGFDRTKRMRRAEVLRGPMPDEWSKEVVRKAFGYSVGWQQEEDSFSFERNEPNYPFKDIVLFDSTQPPTARVVTMTSFDCPSTNRTTWRVRIQSVQETVGARSQGLRPSDPKTMSFETWKKEMETIAPDRLKGLETTFKKLEQRRINDAAQAKRDPAEEVDRRKVADMRSKSTTDRFVDLRDGSYRMRYVGKDGKVSYISIPKPNDDGPSFNAPTPDGRNDAKTSFTFADETGKTWTVDRDFMSREDLTAAEKDMLRTVLTTPIEDDEEATLRRIVTMFPFDIRLSSWRDDRYYNRELIDGLLPFYKGASKKRAFLNELFMSLRGKGAVTSEAKDQIIESFKNIQNVFTLRRKPEKDVFEKPLGGISVLGLNRELFPDLAKRGDVLRKTYEELSQGRLAVNAEASRMRKIETQSGEEVTLKQMIAAQLEKENAYTVEQQKYEAEVSAMRATTRNVRGEQLADAALLNTSYDDKWSEKGPERRDGGRAIVMTNGIDAKDARDTQIMETFLRSSTIDKQISNIVACIQVSKRIDKDGNAKYAATFAYETATGEFFYSYQSAVWKKESGTPDMGMLVNVDRFSAEEKEIDKWLKPQVIELRGTLKQGAKEREKKLVIKEDELKEKLKLAIDSSSEFIPLGKDAKGNELFGMNYEGQLLVMRENGKEVAYKLLPLGDLGQAEGTATEKDVRAMMKGGINDRWNVTALDGDKRIDMQMRLQNKPPEPKGVDIPTEPFLDPEQAILRKVRMTPRQGEKAEDTVRRVFAEFPVKQGELVNMNMEKDLAFVYMNIVAAGGDRYSTEQLREMFTGQLFDIAMKADKPGGLTKQDLEDIDKTVREKMKDGKFGQLAATYATMRSTPVYTMSPNR